ncbi:MAG: hypothetical protein AAF658_08115 [Myxococcota bacterium]
MASRLSFHRQSLVIPSCAEGRAPLDVIEELPPDTLAIVVVNEALEASAAVRASNAETLDALESRYSVRARDADERVSIAAAPWGELVIVDRTGEHALPEKEGVGLARKIGADLALASWCHDPQRSPFIAFTDSDVVLPSDYFDVLHGVDWRCHAGAWHVFRHVEDESAPSDLIWAYEIWLRYHVLGLRYAGSPSAFHTIGSTQSVSATQYAAAGGMPKRQAAEDFYLFNKLAKLGPIVRVGRTPIALSGRLSRRVPFGTGAAMAAWNRERGAERFELYDPRVYEVLARLWTALNEWVEAQDDLDRRLRRDPLLRDCADTIEPRVLPRSNDARARVTSSNALRRRIETAFDAFWTLKLVHALRDNHCPSLEVREALSRAPFVDADTSGGSMRDLALRIEGLEDEVFLAL